MRLCVRALGLDHMVIILKDYGRSIGQTLHVLGKYSLTFYFFVKFRPTGHLV